MAAALGAVSGLTDMFLSLFTTQLKNQNPMEPMDNYQFTSQLAQFTARLTCKPRETESAHDLNDPWRFTASHRHQSINGQLRHGGTLTARNGVRVQ